MKNVNISDMVDQGLCTGCGVCTSETSALKMKLNKDGFLVPQTNKLSTTEALKVCPFNPYPDSIVADEDSIAKIFFPNAKKYDEQIGLYENTYVGYSKEYRKTSSSGGAWPLMSLKIFCQEKLLIICTL